MTIRSDIRRLGFWTLDKMKGGKTRSHYKDISRKMNGDKDNLDVLSNLLGYAKENIPFYNNIEKIDLNSFPVINKNIIIDNCDEFISKEYIDTDLHWTSTSGSTGTPFKSCQNPNKRNRTIADLSYFHKVNSWNLGDKYIYLRAWTSHYKTSKLRRFLQNYIPIDVVNFGEHEKEFMRQKLIKDKTIKVILGYASGLESFVNYLEQKGDHYEMFNLKVIFSVSDNLSDLTKTKLEKMFNCPVINRYSNEELGVLACTSPYDSVFKLNTASYHFELLKLDSDEAVEPGEMGRLVVTDLYNQAMPFIRYDTGDLAISDDPDRNNLRTLSSFQGRVADIIKDVKGNIISAPMVSSYIHKFYKIKQYQLIQDDKNHYIFKVICNEGIYDVVALENACKEFLGEAAVIDVEYVDEISLEKSGKYKTVVNKYAESI